MVLFSAKEADKAAFVPLAPLMPKDAGRDKDTDQEEPGSVEALPASGTTWHMKHPCSEESVVWTTNDESVCFGDISYLGGQVLHQSAQGCAVKRDQLVSNGT